jgi:WD40 repeat protein
MESHFPVVSPVVPAQKMDNQHEVSSPSRFVTEPTVNSIQQQLNHTIIGQAPLENQSQPVSIASPASARNVETTRSDEAENWGLNTIPAQAIPQPIVMHAFFGHSQTIEDVAISPNNSIIASCSRGNSVRLWDSTTGKSEHTFTGHKSFVSAVCFTPDNRVLASGSADKTVRL